MDINAIKAKLEQLNNTGTEDRVDYSKIFWKPAMGKQVIRIVPSKDNPDYPFTELKFHYGIGKFPMLALSNFGKQDPIEEFVKELKKTSDKDNWSLAGKLSPKTRIFAPIIVRGEEDQGVRLWGFGITIFKALLALADDEEIGDYTDPLQGFDLTVTLAAGSPYPTTTVMPKRKESPLSEDSKLVSLWLKEQPDPKDAGKEYSYEYIKAALKAHLSPESEEDEKAEMTEEPNSINTLSKEKTAEEPAPAVTKEYKLDTKKSVDSAASKFNALFDDED